MEEMAVDVGSNKQCEQVSLAFELVKTVMASENEQSNEIDELGDEAMISDAVEDRNSLGETSLTNNVEISTRPKTGKWLGASALTYPEEYFNYAHVLDNEPITSDNFRFFTTSKCSRNLYLQGFVYSLSRSKERVSYWRCQLKVCKGSVNVKIKEGVDTMLWKDIKSTDDLIVTKNANQKFHIHPPYINFDIMVKYYDDRWEKIKKNIPVGGQKLGRFVREGQPVPKLNKGKKKKNMNDMIEFRAKWQAVLKDTLAIEAPPEPQAEGTVALYSGDNEKKPKTLPSWPGSYSKEYYNLEFVNSPEIVLHDRDYVPEPGDLKFFSTTKCRQLLYLKGYVYSLNRVRPCASYWRCQCRGCCGCAVLKMGPQLSGERWQDLKTSDHITVAKNINLNFHTHPPYHSYESMVRFYEDRFQKIKKKVRVGGQRLGRFIKEGEERKTKTKKAVIINLNSAKMAAVDPREYAHIECQVYETSKKGTMLYVEGYLYQVRERISERTHWTCRSRPCRASIVTNTENNVYRVIGKNGIHIHPPADSFEEAIKTRMDALEYQRQNDGLSLPMISLEETKSGEDAANFFEQSLDPGMGESDYSDSGPHDNSMKEEIIVLESCLTISGEKFLQDIVHADDGTKILLFVTQKNVEYLSLASCWLMDSVGSDKMPELFNRLFTIRARVRYGDPLPLVYALITNGSQDAFRALFIYLRAMANQCKMRLNPVFVITELDVNVHQAVREIFNETQVVASHYHLSGMVCDRVCHLQMSQEYLNIETLKATAKKLVALAFLPANRIKEVWPELKANFNDDDEQLLDWFQEVFVLGPVLRVNGDVTFHSDPAFPTNFWSQDTLLAQQNGQRPVQNLQTESFRDWHWKWPELIEKLEIDGVNPLIDILKREQDETEKVIRNHLACHDRQLLGEALSDTLVNRNLRNSLDLVNEVSLLMDLDGPLPNTPSNPHSTLFNTTTVKFRHQAQLWN